MSQFMSLIHFVFTGIFMLVAAISHDIIWALFAVVSSILYLSEMRE